MSDFAVSQAQRRRLLAGDYGPLDFPYEVDKQGKPLPPPCKEGDVYVLSWQCGWATVLDEKTGDFTGAPRRPVWFLTVTSVKRHRKGHWRAYHAVTDIRDTDVFLRRGGGDSSVDELRAGAKPVWTPSMLVRAKAIGEFWHQERLKRHAEERKKRGRARIKRAA